MKKSEISFFEEMKEFIEETTDDLKNKLHECRQCSDDEDEDEEDDETEDEEMCPIEEAVSRTFSGFFKWCFGDTDSLLYNRVELIENWEKRHPGLQIPAVFLTKRRLSQESFLIGLTIQYFDFYKTMKDFKKNKN